MVCPFFKYLIPIWISSKSSKISSFVRATAVYPLTIEVYCNRGMSSHPQRRLRPVVTPNSWPLVCRNSPMSYKERNYHMIGFPRILSCRQRKLRVMVSLRISRNASYTYLTFSVTFFK